jgi:hypothetical protein
MSDALLQEDVPADTDAANRRSYHLAGVVSTEADGDRIRVAIDWRLVGADGRSVATESEREEVPEAAWAKGDAEMAKALVAKAALRLAKRVEGDAPQEHAVNAPVVAVAPVTGASGDGGHALSLAMTDALRRGGLALKDNQDDPANFLLTGRVAIGTPTAGHQQIKIVWILSGAKGQEIGRVSQENAVPAGSLDGAWGDTAYDVATAAATGIVSLIQRAQGAPAGG